MKKSPDPNEIRNLRVRIPDVDGVKKEEKNEAFRQLIGHKN
jgi:hypothetical protein